MALFKIKRGLAANLPTTYVEGYCYVTTDDGKFYIDTSNAASGRIVLNAAKADSAGKWTAARKISISSTAGTTGTNIDGSAAASLIIPATMSGFNSITTKKLIVGTTSAAAHIQFQRESYNYLVAPKNGTIAFSPGSAEAAGDFSGVGAHLAVTYGAVIPGQNNNVVNLGSSSYKWKNVYATTFTGSLSGNASTATRLANTRTFTTNLASTTSGSFDGSANVTVGVTGVLPLSHGGTDNNLQNATKGSIVYMASDGSGMWYSSVGTSGQLLTSGGNGAPTWTTATNSNTASTVVKRDSSGNFSAGTITATLSGNASTASKWATARTITLKQGASGSVSIDGSANQDLNVTGISESYLTWGGKNINGGVSPVGAALSAEHSANRLAYLNPNALYYEYSDNGGSTWTAMNVSNETKIGFVTTNGTVSVGNASTVTTNHRTRITLTAQDGTNGYVYTRPRKLLLNVSTAGHGLTVKIEIKTGVSGASWTTVGEYSLSGWSGWNDIPLSFATLGGGKSQTSNNWYMRLTFATTSVNSNYTTTKTSIIGMRLFGDTCWTRTSNMGETGHLYSYDTAQNATFPAKVTATSFAGSGASLTALNASNINAGTLAAARLPASGVTAGTYGLDAAASPAHGGKFLVPKIVVDTTGRITAAAEYEVTLPADSNTHYTTGIRAGVSGTNSNSEATNPYIKVLDDTTYRSQIQLAGSGLTTISSDTNGKITINTSINKANVTTALGYTPDTPAQVDAKVAALVDSAPSTLNTLNELAAALGDDANFATTVTNSIAARVGSVDAAGTAPLTLTGSISGGKLTLRGSVANATTSAAGVVTTSAQSFAGNKMFTGDILLHMADTDRSIVFSYANSTTVSPSASWRLAGLGSGSSDTNYFVIQSGTSGTAGTEVWNNVIRLGQNTFDAAFGGNLYPLTNNSKTLGTSSYKWSNIYATKVNGYTLAAACAKGVTDSSSASAISNTGTSLPTERDIYYGLPTINNSHSYTSSTTIYAPTAGGSSGQYLKAVGATSAPTWASFTNLTINVTNLAGTTTQTVTYNPSSAKTLNIAATDILETYTFTESKTLTTSWADTGVAGADMAEGSYIIQVKINDTATTGLWHYSEVYTGVLSWDAATTNSTDYDEIVLHKAGHASNGNNIYLRTTRKASSGYLTLQICCNKTCTTATSYTITARRLLS